MTTREFIMNHFKSSLSVGQIAIIVKQSHSTSIIHDIIKAFRKEKTKQIENIFRIRRTIVIKGN